MIDFIQSIAICVLGMTVIIQGFTIGVHTRGLSSVNANLTRAEKPRSDGKSVECQENVDSETSGTGADHGEA